MQAVVTLYLIISASFMGIPIQKTVPYSLHASMYECEQARLYYETRKTNPLDSYYCE